MNRFGSVFDESRVRTNERLIGSVYHVFQNLNRTKTIGLVWFGSDTLIGFTLFF
jgi:hypothetical protein